MFHDAIGDGEKRAIDCGMNTATAARLGALLHPLEYRFCGGHISDMSFKRSRREARPYYFCMMGRGFI